MKMNVEVKKKHQKDHNEICGGLESTCEKRIMKSLLDENNWRIEIKHSK